MSRPILLQIHHRDSDEATRGRLEKAAKAGLAGVDWMVETAEQATDLTGVLSSWKPPACQNIPPTRAVSLDWTAGDWGEMVERCRTLMPRAHAHGAALLTVRPPRPNVAAPGFSSYREGLNAAYSLLRTLRFEAETFGLVLSLLVPRDGFLVSPVEARELIERVNNWNIGATIDLDRAARYGMGADWLETLGGRVQGILIGSGASIDDSNRCFATPTEVFPCLERFVPEDRPIILDARVPESDWCLWSAHGVPTSGESRRMETL